MNDKQYWVVLDTVLRLEVSKGHLRWTLSELSRLSGVGRTLIYYYFGKSKESIIQTAIRIIGEEFFGLSAERMELWKAGDIKQSVLKTREILVRAPYIVEFYFHWRSRKSEIRDELLKLERNFQNKIQKFRPGQSREAFHVSRAIFFGLVLLEDIDEKSIDAALGLIK